MLSTEQLLALKARCLSAKANGFELGDAASMLAALGAGPGVPTSVDGVLALVDQHLKGAAPTAPKPAPAPKPIPPKPAAPVAAAPKPPAPAPKPAPKAAEPAKKPE